MGPKRKSIWARNPPPADIAAKPCAWCGRTAYDPDRPCSELSPSLLPEILSETESSRRCLWEARTRGALAAADVSQ
jgi:hypothetical protein